MMGFQKKLIAYNTRKKLKKNNTLRNTVAYAEMKKAAILFTAEDMHKHGLVKGMVKQLENDGKDVTVLCLLGEGQDNFEFLFNFFGESDFDLMGNSNSMAIDNFNNASFDYLFHLDVTPNYLIEYVLAGNKAKCRIGPHFEVDKNAYYDMMIHLAPEEGLRELINNMYHYVKKISTQ